MRSEVVRERGDMIGTDRARLSGVVGLSTITCGGVEAGNEADSETGLDGLRESYDDMWRVCFFGGVGGVDIQVGAANNMRSEHEFGGVSSLDLSLFFVGVRS